MSFALITGASKGIGKCLAESLAKRKFDLLLVARTQPLLQKLSEELKSKYGVAVHFLATDLAEKNAAQKVHQWVLENKFEISILVNNAGYGLWGKFDELTLEEQNEMVGVNNFTMVNLTHLMIPELAKQKQSYIMNVASTAAYQAVPMLTLYSASKAFVLSFSRGLYHELKSKSISVTCLSPGGTKTDFIERAKMYHMQKISDKMSMEPETVAEIGVKAMLAKRAEIIAGLVNKIGAAANNFVPKKLIEKIAGNIYAKKN